MPHNGYSDAMDSLVTISPAAKGAVYRATISGTEGDWRVELTGNESQQMRRLIRHAGAHEAPDLAYQDDHDTFRVWTGVVGRVPLMITVVTHILHRVSGRV